MKNDTLCALIATYLAWSKPNVLSYLQLSYIDVSLRTTSADSMTSKPSEDEISVGEFAAPDAEGTASVFATEVDVAKTVVSSDAAI